ncbi:MAG: hypothetical protein LBS43_01785 [Prevotellaceae bacterium]|jgi:hypothetical protein|nr:hypothetical protein [Prevotellaceae bacterium]
MKRFKKALLFIFLVFIAIQGSSGDDYDYYAVYMDRANLEKSVFYLETGKDMKNPGKIYYKHPYLFVNEKYKGVHVFDNTDPANPVKKGFIIAPGCLDMAVKDNIIYLDNAVDLVSFDLSAMKETKRITKVFPELAPPNGRVLWYPDYEYDRPENLIIVEWAKR